MKHVTNIAIKDIKESRNNDASQSNTFKDYQIDSTPQRDAEKIYPLKMEYFDFHGRGLQLRMLLNYLKDCNWEDCPMSNEDFAKNKESGYLKYGQLPCLTLQDGQT